MSVLDIIERNVTLAALRATPGELRRVCADGTDGLTDGGGQRNSNILS